ncbi:MAG: hypothetical protein IPJ40_01470 [Saprospirales bacterium]|nr:hypothetical protein [Saprospirales bacterium]
MALLFIGLLAVLPVQQPLADACGPSTQGFKGYSFLSPGSLGPEIQDYPVLLRFQDIYQFYIDSTVIRQKKATSRSGYREPVRMPIRLIFTG